MKHLVRTLSILLSLLCCIYSHAENIEVNGIYYSLNKTDLTATVQKHASSNGYVGIINIPEKVSYNNVEYSVTAIASSTSGGAFYGNKALTSVTIPSSITSIGTCAFEGCSGLTSVTIPNSVTSIGNFAFDGCSSLTSISIPNSVTSIGNTVFRNCSFTSITIPNSVRILGDHVFEGCSSLKTLRIPPSVNSIGSGLISGIAMMDSLIIEDGVNELDVKELYSNFKYFYMGRELPNCTTYLLANSETFDVGPNVH